MTHLTCSPVDFVKELRLRRWARTNYVPAEQRKSNWHAVVLDEMSRRDVEVRDTPAPRASISSYVPLPPSSLQKLHGAHSLPPSPNLIPHSVRAESCELS